MGRPRKIIDANLIEKAAALGCTVEEIGTLANCSPDTIQRRFAASLTKGRTALKTRLRRWQLREAKKGNSSLLIFLGKSILGQREVQEIELSAQGRLTVEAPAPPCNSLTFSQALQMIETLKIEMSPEKIAAAERAELGDTEDPKNQG